MPIQDDNLTKQLKKKSYVIDTQEKSEMIKENKYVHKIEEPDPMMLMAQMQAQSQKKKAAPEPEENNSTSPVVNYELKRRHEKYAQEDISKEQEDEKITTKRSVEGIIHGPKATQKFKVKHTPARYALYNMYKGKYQACIENGNDKAELKRKKNSSLYTKSKNANVLNKTEREIAEENYKNFNYYYGSIGNDYNQQIYKDLSQFMVSSDKSENMTILSLYLGESIQDLPGKKGAKKTVNKQLALDNMTKVLMKLDITDFSMRNDREIIRHARKLERITSMTCAYDSLHKDNPDYMAKLVTNDLNREDNNNQEQEHYLRKSLEEVRKRLDVLRAIAAYYTARKNVMTDPYYINHPDSEITMDVTKDSPEDQRALAEKMADAYYLGRNMMRINGKSVLSLGKLNTPNLHNDYAKDLLNSKSGLETAEDLQKAFLQGDYVKLDGVAEAYFLKTATGQKLAKDTELGKKTGVGIDNKPAAANKPAQANKKPGEEPEPNKAVQKTQVEVNQDPTNDEPIDA